MAAAATTNGKYRHVGAGMHEMAVMWRKPNNHRHGIGVA